MNATPHTEDKLEYIHRANGELRNVFKITVGRSQDRPPETPWGKSDNLNKNYF
jgi:hypothetical protein